MNVHLHAFQEPSFVLSTTNQCLMMTMPVDDRVHAQWRRTIVRLLDEEFAQQECALHDLPRLFPLRKQAMNFVAHHRPATRLKQHDRNSLLDIGYEHAHHLAKVTLCLVEKPMVVQRTAATDMLR